MPSPEMTVPIETSKALSERLALVYDGGRHQEILSQINQSSVAVRKQRWSLFWRGISTLVSLGAVVALYQLTEALFFAVLFAVMGVAWLVALIRAGRVFSAMMAAYARTLATALTPLMADTLMVPLSVHTNAVVDDVSGILQQSQLLTETVHTLHVDDSYQLQSTHGLIVVQELRATKTVQEGKHSRTVTVFHGTMAIIPLVRPLTGRTFVSTEGDKYGFAHRNFWTALTGSSNINETILEWNQFESDLHVATNDPVEARYILTPDFMVALHDWWLEHTQNIRLVFYGTQLVMLLPDTKVRVGYVPLSTDHKKLLAYTETILRPLWRTLRLVETVGV